VANALAVAERRQRITQEGIEEFLELLRKLPIQIERRPALWLWQAALPLARDYGLTAYDAAYLELARRERMHLATLDHGLQEVSLRLGVPILQVS
jgi:predicted nucleic acid-binding protein